MKIDLDEVLAAIAPAPVTIRLRGKDYALRELSLGEVLILQTLGEGETNGRMIERVKGLFAGEVPPLLDELLQLDQRLQQRREQIAAKRPQLAENKRAAKESITSADVRDPKGELPKAWGDLPEMEDHFGKLNVAFGLLLGAVTAAVAEITPGNRLAAGLPMIRRQIQSQAASGTSPGSASPSPGEPG